jgi:integrase/recombinase XerD
MQRKLSPPTVKHHLAVLRMLFDWLVMGEVMDANPAHSVRGPKYVVKKGKTPVLAAEEARELLDSIPIVRNTGRDDPPESAEPALSGLRDRAIIALMVYTFVRINAVLEMKVRDYFVRGWRGWVRLHEKGGKEHELPCHHNLEQYLGPLFRTAAGKTGALTRNAMWQQDAYRMIQRRATAAGLKTRIGNHTFRATGTLETAQSIANHESPRTTKLYDRRQDEISLDEVERIAI